ncbi:MAG TPA: CDP-alcohol phosphatidyltransferase family protein [Candidatus Saccharicenans sp.]|jgi:CDP-diacylglycerol--glycerol-3-phosphate 3-phosphatidyltransferase|nr:CDP-alcohol phosphatidyltransferase family protein [Candidatus Saccharicenans sp.]HRD01709.1 CDP-alcohol phosphatidyltransferase family protein [Candidatus Saccharicenans sp.]
MAIFKSAKPESLASGANLITLLRLVTSLIFFCLAAIYHLELYNYLGLGIHWLGDWLDGFWARTFQQRTIIGAEIDIIADRIESLFFFINFIFFHPGLALPVTLYIMNFAFVDFYLSYQFIKFDIISIDFFYLVDQKVYRLNFSQSGKFINSTVIPLLLILLPGWWPVTLILTAGLMGVKLYSIFLLRKKESLARQAK